MMTPDKVTCNKSCWFTDNYRRQCDDGRYDLMGKTAQECLEHCVTHEYCYHAHWHPPNQIWPEEDRSVCFIWPVGTANCDWNGGEFIPGPDAQMIQCTPTKCELSNPYCRTGKEGAYCDYEDDGAGGGLGTAAGLGEYVCKTCENINTQEDCASHSVDQNTSTCLKDCLNIGDAQTTPVSTIVPTTFPPANASIGPSVAQTELPIPVLVDSAPP